MSALRCEAIALQTNRITAPLPLIAILLSCGSLNILKPRMLAKLFTSLELLLHS
uniref:Uncharacterized protein n=1 Tax=Physcomitrium patens TaxID=3218 RepID=A0A2K1KIW3_PHYPA|nr:hypothetical protein PHYPA_007384 [Physcomitrium patens]